MVDFWGHMVLKNMLYGIKKSTVLHKKRFLSTI